VPGQAGLDLLGVSQQVTSLAGEQFPRLGEPDAPAVPLGKPLAGLPL